MNKLNRLSKASSPYLRQHATNPVDWYEWSDEALTKARTENKPMIISIGYAACHWCHVMAHESFSDDEIAAFMNEHFVCIKIDREEKPDIDQIYMDAAHIITGRGGWPLNAIALPDGRPFYASTYFPPQQWLDVLQQLHQVYETDYTRVLKAAESITQGINASTFSTVGAEKSFSKDWYQAAYEQHIRKIDFQLGGYKKAPKFMMPIGLEFFLQYHYLTGENQAIQAITTALDAMTNGGLNDQIGGGFARYSTDEQWLVPHFEKMLYDNAQLISLYSKAYQATGNTDYIETAEKTMLFAERELLDISGGFYASIDADSEHEEGKFYVWSKQEIDALCAENAEWVRNFYGITESGNWEHGKNILHRTNYATELLQKSPEYKDIISQIDQKLLAARNKRIRPTTDDKIICAWNSMMISAYVSLFKTTGNSMYLQKAKNTASFIEKYLLKEDGSLFRVYKEEKVSVDAFLDDYAFFMQALIDLYEICFDPEYLKLTQKILDYVDAHFANEPHDMYYYTSDSTPHLVARKYEYSDNVIPASNSVLAHVLFRFGKLTDNSKYILTAEAMLKLMMDELVEYGPYHANWAMLLGKMTYPFKEVVIAGKNTGDISLNLQQKYLPDCLFAGGDQEYPALLTNRISEGKTLIYVCEDKTCEWPVETVAEAISMIQKNPAQS